MFLTIYQYFNFENHSNLVRIGTKMYRDLFIIVILLGFIGISMQALAILFVAIR